MASRREFLQATALAALPLATRAMPDDPAVSLTTSAPRIALLEAPVPEARLFGARLEVRGAQLLEVPPYDPAPLWFGHIQPLWSRESAPVAGLTSLSTLFCFEQLAWQHGLRVVFHAEHLLRNDGSVTHELLRGAYHAQTGPDSRTWPLRAADSLTFTPMRAGAARSGPSLAGLEPTVPPGARLLASWLIA